MSSTSSCSKSANQEGAGFASLEDRSFIVLSLGGSVSVSDRPLLGSKHESCLIVISEKGWIRQEIVSFWGERRI